MAVNAVEDLSAKGCLVQAIKLNQAKHFYWHNYRRTSRLSNSLNKVARRGVAVVAVEDSSSLCECCGTWSYYALGGHLTYIIYNEKSYIEITSSIVQPLARKHSSRLHPNICIDRARLISILSCPLWLLRSPLVHTIPCSLIAVDSGMLQRRTKEYERLGPMTCSRQTEFVPSSFPLVLRSSCSAEQTHEPGQVRLRQK